jgi:hypothetical protein
VVGRSCQGKATFVEKLEEVEKGASVHCHAMPRFGDGAKSRSRAGKQNVRGQVKQELIPLLHCSTGLASDMEICLGKATS